MLEAGRELGPALGRALCPALHTTLWHLLPALQTHLFFFRTAAPPRLSPHLVCFPCLGPICKLRDYRLFFQSPFFFFFPFYVAGHEVKVFFVCFRGAFSTISEGRQKRRYLRRSAFAVTTAPSCGTAAAPAFGRESPASPGARPGRPREVCGVRWVRRAARCPAVCETGAPGGRLHARIASERSTVQPERGSTDPTHRFCTTEIPCNPQR